MFINDIFKKKLNENGSDSQKYMQPDRGATPPKTGTEKPIDTKPIQQPKNIKDPKDYMTKGVGEDAIDARLTAQYNTPQAKAQSQSIDQAFASGKQADFDRLGIMSPQQIERDYQAMRAKEPAQDAALMKNPALTPGARTQTLKTNPKGVPIREREVDEAGPFSYGAKKPRKGSVADLAAKKRKEQERDKQPVEPKDHMVGSARVVKGVAEGWRDTIKAGIKGAASAYNKSKLDRENIQKQKDFQKNLIATRQAIQKKIIATRQAEKKNKILQFLNGISNNGEFDIEDWGPVDVSTLNDYISNDGLIDADSFAYDTARELNFISRFGLTGDYEELLANFANELNTKISNYLKQGVAEGSAQDKLYKRHQELRKKSGLPDPDYYKELKASYDLPDEERYAKQKEIKQKYKVTNEDRERYIEELQRAGYELVTEKRMTCPECGGAAYEDKILAEKQDACYHKVKSRYKVWPSAYASGALVKCRKKGAKNWGNKSK